MQYADDSSRNSKGKAAEEDAISIETLVEIIEESMRVFWDFIRADRHEPDGGLKQSQLNEQDSADLVLMTALRAQLQKVCCVLHTWAFHIILHVLFKMSAQLIESLLLAEGKKAQGHSEERKLHSEEVPKAS